jgi:hypothetical protein
MNKMAILKKGKAAAEIAEIQSEYARLLDRVTKLGEKIPGGINPMAHTCHGGEFCHGGTGRSALTDRVNPAQTRKQ